MVRMTLTCVPPVDSRQIVGTNRSVQEFLLQDRSLCWQTLLAAATDCFVRFDQTRTHQPLLTLCQMRHSMSPAAAVLLYIRCMSNIAYPVLYTTKI